MKKSFFEQKGIIYTPTGEYLLPGVELPAEEARPVGIWGQRRLWYLKQHRRILYCNLLTSGKLHSHVADIEEQAQALFSRLVEAYADREGVTETLKAQDSMAWVGKMNNIRSRVTEIVNNELIYN